MMTALLGFISQRILLSMPDCNCVCDRLLGDCSTAVAAHKASKSGLTGWVHQEGEKNLDKKSETVYLFRATTQVKNTPKTGAKSGCGGNTGVYMFFSGHGRHPVKKAISNR